LKRRFDFKLARLMRVRTIQEEVARGEWSMAEAEALQAEAAELALREELQASRHELGVQVLEGGSLSTAAVLASHRALDAQLTGIDAAAASSRTCRQQADKLAQIWRKTEQDRRGLQELAEREKVRHRIQLEREEEAARDEASQGRFSMDSQGDSSADLSQAEENHPDGSVLALLASDTDPLGRPQSPAQ
jgi:flagellar export protein FliJ